MNWAGTNIRMLFMGLLQFCFATTFCQSGLYFFIDSNTIIGNLLNNQLYVSETEIAYTVQGNIIFSGDSNTKENILFTINAKEILSNKVGLVYQADAKTIQYLTHRGAFFLGDHPMEDYKKLVTIKQINDSLFEIKGGIDTSLLGVVEGRFESQAQIVLAAHLYIRHYNLDKQIQHNLNSIDSNYSVDETNGLIRPLYNSSGYYAWEWDGKTLKPAYGYRPEDEWKFDGRYLEPVWSLDPQSEWEWDGKILKPTWDNSSQNQWIWEDQVLKSFWDSNPDKMWVIEETVVRPMWNFSPALQWEIQGQVPLPIIALVILGKADR